ncbi:MAG: hypothetical protein AAB445_00830 [Patescibacteria group bacterium]
MNYASLIAVSSLMHNYMGREGEGNPEDVNLKAPVEESESNEEKMETFKEEAPIDRPLLKAFVERFSAYPNTRTMAEMFRRVSFEVALLDDNGKELKYDANYHSVCRALERTKGTEENDQAIDILEKAMKGCTNEWEDIMKTEEPNQIPFKKVKENISEDLQYVQQFMEAAGEGSDFDKQLNSFYDVLEPLYQKRESLKENK